LADGRGAGDIQAWRTDAGLSWDGQAVHQ
jgi:hypothetical protein